jgi:type IV fimbrial biogenesis protein FimT
MRNSQKGFTLLETLVTAGIAGMMAAITFPSLSSSLSAHRLMAGLRSTVGCIRVARSSAISRNKYSQVVVDGSATTLTVQVSPDATTWTSIGTPLVLDGGVTVSSVSPANGLGFKANGSINNASSSAVTLTLQNARGDTHQITVSLLGSVDLS